MSFNILNQPNYELATEITEAVGDSINDRIENIIKSSDIVLFMKGNVTMPQCGFSANSGAIILSYGKEFNTFNILTDEEIRQGIKEYSNWPTFPQLYVKGKLVGGNDIIMELHEDGELEGILKS